MNYELCTYPKKIVTCSPITGFSQIFWLVSAKSLFFPTSEFKTSHKSGKWRKQSSSSQFIMWPLMTYFYIKRADEVHWAQNAYIRATSFVQNIFSVVSKRRIVRDKIYLTYRRKHSFSRIFRALLWCGYNSM
jgi:hypothetical protein